MQDNDDDMVNYRIVKADELIYEIESHLNNGF